MIKYLSYIIFPLLIINNVLAEDWETSYREAERLLQKQNFSEASVTADTALIRAEKEFGKKDTNYINTLRLAYRAHFICGEYKKAKNLAVEDSNLSITQYGAKSNAYALSMDELGDICFKTADYSGAVNKYAEALELLRRKSTGNTIELASAIRRLADAYKVTGRFDEAEPLYLESLEMLRKLYPGVDPNKADGLMNAARFYQSQGEYDKAEPLFREAFEMLKQLYKDRNIRLARIYYYFGDFFYETSNYRAAEPMLKEALRIYREIFPGDHSEPASVINTLAELYDDKGQFEEAGKLYKEALDIRRRIYNYDHPELAESINNMALYYQSRSNFAEAEPLFKESLQMYRRLFKGDNPDLALSINNMAYFYESQGRYRDAEPLYKEALDMYRRIYKGDHPELVSSMNNLAMIYNKLGKYKEVEKLYKESIAMARRIYKGDHPDLANSINSLASFYDSQAEYGKAEVLYNEALAMYRRLIKGDHPFLARSISNLGAFYNNLGRYSEAEPLYKEALAMYRRLFKGPNSYLATSLNELANFYMERANYAKAEPLFKEALSMARKLYNVNHPRLAKMINNVANFYKARGMYKQAGPLYKEALEITRNVFKGDHPDLATAINSMATFYSDNGEHEKAEKLYTEALEMRKRLFQGDHPSIASSLGNMAYLFEEKGEYKKAEQYYTQAMQMRRRLYKNDQPDLAQSINSLGTFYTFRKQFDKARPLLKESLAMNRRLYGKANQALINSLNALAAFYNDIGKPDSAKPLYIEALKDVSEIINSYFPSLSEMEKTYFWNSLKGNFSRFNTFVYNNYKKDPELISYMYDNQLETKAILLNAVRKVRERIYESNDSSLINLLKKWQANREYLVNLYQLPVNSPVRQNANIDSIEKATNEIEKELSLRSELFAKQFEKKAVTWKDVRSCLNREEAAIEIIRFRKFGHKTDAHSGEFFLPAYTDTVFYAALIITSKTKSNPKLVFIKDGNALESMYISQYRRATQFSLPDNDSYSAFWAKIAAGLKKVNRLYVSLDGVYNNINLNTIYNPHKKRYLIDDYDIRIVTNTRDIIDYKNRKKEEELKTAVLFGDPAYNLDTNARKFITPLPGTKKEVRLIAGDMKKDNWDVRCYLGPDATEEKLKEVNNPGVLHIATHGVFLENDSSSSIFGSNENFDKNPLLRSMLLFAGSENYLLNKNIPRQDTEDIKNRSNDGLLTAYEAMNLNLDSTEVVVLSACETGLGELKNGEGVYGLQRAFLVAGSKSLIMSLWNVNDQTTQELMTKFYAKWLSGMDKRKAFRQAQLELKKKYPGMSYWGAFVMVGE